MRTKLFAFFILIACSQWACEKTNFTTKPQLTFLRLSSSDLVVNTPLLISMQVTDKEGDLRFDGPAGDSSTLFYQKVSRNCTLSNNVIARYPIPLRNNTPQLSAELELNFIYTNQGGIQNPVPIGNACTLVPGRPNDTCVFKIWIRDNAMNVSDTVTTPQIILRRP